MNRSQDSIGPEADGQYPVTPAGRKIVILSLVNFFLVLFGLMILVNINISAEQMEAGVYGMMFGSLPMTLIATVVWQQRGKRVQTVFWMMLVMLIISVCVIVYGNHINWQL